MHLSKFVIIINGAPQSGKDSFVDVFEETKFLKLRLSSVDQIKKAASKLGWKGEKTPNSRKFLSDLKELSTEYNNGPFRYIKKKIMETEGGLISVMIREKEEIIKLKKWCKSNDIRVITILITRPGYEGAECLTSSDLEANVYDTDVYDTILRNNFADLEGWRNYILNILIPSSYKY